MSLRRHLVAASLLLALALPSMQLAAEPFTFQGFLEQSGSPLNGNVNLAFKLYDAQSGGSQQGATISANAYPVLDGVFTLDLNFVGVAFADANRWLQVEVNGTPMGPRIEILPAPVAASARALQGHGVSATVPSSGQVLKWNGSAWAPAADAGGGSYTAGAGLLLNGTEFSANFAGSGAANSVARSDHGHYGSVFGGSSALQGLNITQTNASNGANGLFSIAQSASGETTGVVGVSMSATSGATGVAGMASAASGTTTGVSGRSDSSNGRGVHGLATAGSGSTVGVWGSADSTAGSGVRGSATAASGLTYGIHGTSASSTGIGVYGAADRGVVGEGSTTGVDGQTSGAVNAAGVRGSAAHPSADVRGVAGLVQSPLGIAVAGENLAASGNAYGVAGATASPAGTGVFGSAINGGTGVRGEGETGMVAQGESMGLDGAASDPAGQAIGVRGSTGSPDGAGVFAINSAASGNAYGAYAQTNSTAGTALVGDALATSGSNRGVLARTASSVGVGLRAENTATSGGGSGNALVAVGNLPSGDTLVVEANGTSSAWAIRTRSAGTRTIDAELTTPGVTGATISASVNSVNGRAGQFINSAGGGTAASFVGNVDVSGTLSKGGGSFKIDHPLDPANKYLLHSFVESPDMMNIYNGNVVTDANGRATIELPEWFETLNRDFRYQLTVIGEFAQAIVSKKVEQNRFEIRTSSPKVEVSWQVTGIRHDAWAERNRIPVELEKSGDERGKFLHPEAHSQPADKRIGTVADTKE